MNSSSRNSTMNQTDFRLLQTAISEVMDNSRLHPDLNAYELTLLLTLSHHERNQMTIVQAICSLASSRALDEQEKEPKKALWNVSSSHKNAPNGGAVVPRTSPSAIEGWDLIDNSTSPDATTGILQVDASKENETEQTPLDGVPTENDMIVTDFAENKEDSSNEPILPEVQNLSQEEEEDKSTRSGIQQCVILGTLQCMVVELMQLQQQTNHHHHPNQEDSHGIATHIYERCSTSTTDDSNNNASILYEAALAIALLVPFTATAAVVVVPSTSQRSDGLQISKQEGSEPTFLGHKVGEDHHPAEVPSQPASDVAIPNDGASIEFLVLEPTKDGLDRLYIGSVVDNVPHGVGCTIHAKKKKKKKKDKRSPSDTIRTTCGIWNKGIMNE